MGGATIVERLFTIGFWCAVTLCGAHAWGDESIDLCGARVLTLRSSAILDNARDMLRDEVKVRTRIALPLAAGSIAANEAVIVIGTVADFENAGLASPDHPQPPGKPDGFSLWVGQHPTGAVSVNCMGHDERGTMYAVGRLLRLLHMERDAIRLDQRVRIVTAPRYGLRGHQLGYRPKTHSYDSWTLETWEQYYRDMIVFGMNAVELVPPKTDDHFDSPHFPRPPLEMMIAMSRLAADYGLEVWIWYPGVERDFSDSLTMDYAMRERDKVLGQLPRVDAVFVPSGDPSEIHPDQLFPLMRNMKRVLNRHHPHATIWSSLQNYDDSPETSGWIAAFYAGIRRGDADWLDGMVFGPATEVTLASMRRELPARLPIRRYPDITHSRKCQYEVPDWDPAYHATQGREIINPRPRAYAKIFRDHAEDAIGFISYSEGCNDDVNKVLWSTLGWDPDRDVEEVMTEYARYFIGPAFAQSFAQGLFMLEENWQGSLLDNEVVDATLKHFQKMEHRASPRQKLNWRFQQALYRAYFDAYTRARLEYETALEDEALQILGRAAEGGSLKALDAAQNCLARAERYPVRPEWRARIFELGEALYQSIQMQLSVPKYQAKQVGRGANLDLIDVPLNNRPELLEKFAAIRPLAESERLAEIAKLGASERGSIEDDWEDEIEERLAEDDPSWAIRRGADDLEHRPAVRASVEPVDPMARGLVGFRSHNKDFNDADKLDELEGFDNQWTSQDEEWSGYWTGYLKAPITGPVTFTAKADDGVRLEIDEQIVIDGLGREGERTGRVALKEGHWHPIRVWYYQDGGPSHLQLLWGWNGQPPMVIAQGALLHGPENVRHASRFLD